MEINLLKNKRGTITTIVLFFIILGIGFSLVQKFKYEAVTKVLVYQKFPAGTDIYSINRSNEYLSSVLAEIVLSDSFYDEVIKSGFNIDENYFSKDNNFNDAIKKWTKTVNAKPAVDSGIIEVKAYHTDRYQAEQIARAVNFILVTKNQNYHGGGDNVVIKVIDKPIVSNLPVKPNLPVNVGLAFIVGLSIALAYVYLFPEEKYDLSLRRGRKKSSAENAADAYNQEGQKYNWHSLGNILENKKESQRENVIYGSNRREEAVFRNESGYENILNKGSMKNLR